MARPKRARAASGGEAVQDGEEQQKSSSISNEISSGTIVIGSYDGGLVGVQASDGKQTFGYSAHSGCVRSLSCSEAGKLATGGTDHAAKLFDLIRRREVGELQEHESGVSCVEFWSNTLVTGGEDGQVCIWRCSDWELLLKFKAHKVGIAAFAIHPSGRMMASCGRDGSVKLWDMTRGTSAANLTCSDVPSMIQWSPSGQSIALMSSNELQVVQLENGTVAKYKEATIAGAAQVPLTAMVFLSDEAILVGNGTGNLKVLKQGAAGKLDVVGNVEIDAAGARRPRVKTLIAVHLAKDSADTSFIACGLSTGLLELWRVEGGKEVTHKSFERLYSVETNIRLTCMASFVAKGDNGKKQVVEAVEAADDEEGNADEGSAGAKKGGKKMRKKRKTQ